MILQIREETHKTAIEFHRKRREKRDFTSELSEIPGVGEKRKMKLLKHFGSIERIAKATVEELRRSSARKPRPRSPPTSKISESSPPVLRSRIDIPAKLV